ncbi:hypothetical protein CRUP_015884, partial [Coryphaenoides rupestris]
ARYRREHGQPRSAPPLPLVDNLLKDTADGCVLGALLHFYCPQAVPMDDICLKETMSLADSLYNLQLVQDFCRDNLNHCCHFSLEDMLYAHASVKSNYLVFMAELFWWFEVVKPSFVQPRVFDPQACEPAPVCRNMAPVSSPVKQSYADRPVSPEHAPAAGAMKRSTSMSYVDGCVGTWPKENRSRGISFEIPLDGDLSERSGEGPASHRGGMTRSASSDGLGFKVHYATRGGGSVGGGGMKRHQSLMPVSVNGQSDSHRHIAEEEEDYSPISLWGGTTRSQSRAKGLPDGHNNHGNHSGHISPTTPPSIEEALKIIHDSERPHGSLGLGAADSGFFLHGAAEPLGRHGPPGVSPEPPGSPGSPGKADAHVEPNSLSTEEVDTGIHVRTEDIQSLDEDSSSLRDYSDIDPDYEAATRSCPLPDRGGRSAGGVGETGGGGGGDGARGGLADNAAVPRGERAVATLPRSHTVSPISSSGGSGGGMVRMTSFAEQKFRKLEGRSSGGTTPESSELNMASHPRPIRALSAESAGPPLPITSPATPSPRDPSHMLASEMVHLKMKLEEKRRAIEAQKKKQHGRRPAAAAAAASPSSAEPDGQAPQRDSELLASLGPAERIDIAEYTRSIERLNTSLGFLQTEMQRLAQQQREDHGHEGAAGLGHPSSRPSPHSSVVGRGSGRGSVGSLSPILSSTGSPRAPHRSPAGIKRRPASFHARTPRTPRPNDLKVTPFSRMLNTPTSVDSLPRLRRFNPSQTQTCSFAYLGHDEGPVAASDHQQGPKTREDAERKSAGALQSSTKGPTADPESRNGARRESGPATEEGVISSEVRSRPAPETQEASGHRGKADQSSGQGRRDLREVPLCQPDQAGEEEGMEDGGAARDAYGDDQMCCGFFFKAEEEEQRRDGEKARRDYIKNEYLRRKQLKLMEDMNDVIKPRSGSLKKKPRPKSIHRDVVESPKPPVRATGVRPRGYSVSSVSLASLNLADNNGNQSDNRRTPRHATGESTGSRGALPRSPSGHLLKDTADGCVLGALLHFYCPQAVPMDDAVPEELAEPFYLDQYCQEHLKPPVASLLQSAELYCRAGSLILRSDAVKPLLGHNAVIQALAQKCLYVTDQDRLVTERDLTGSPIHMSSHLALVDTLMMAYTVEMVSVERVMSCIHRCAAAEPSYADAGRVHELPYDTEDAITTWINKMSR